MENQQQQANTNLCRAGCGFFGADATEGLCSKCYKDNINRKQDTTARMNSPQISVPMAASSSSSSASPHLSSSVIAAVADAVAAAQQASSSSSSSSSATTPLVTAAATPAAPIAERLTCSSEAHALEEAAAKLESAVAAGAEVILSSSSSSCTLDSAAAAAELPAGPPAKKVNRCQMCKKRVGLTGFSCRCGGLYCSEHRYDNVHACTFDYKTMEREQIAKNNPVVVSDKIQRI